MTVSQVSNLTLLPFGQFLVINSDHLAKRRERPYHVGLGFHEPVKMGAIGSLAGEDGLARCRQALGLLPPVRVGRNPCQLVFQIRRYVSERSARIHLPLCFARIVQDMFAGREIALVVLKHPDQGCP